MLPRQVTLLLLAALAAGGVLVWALLGPASGKAPGGTPADKSRSAESTAHEPESGALQSDQQPSGGGDAALERRQIVAVEKDDQSAQEQRAGEVVDKARMDGREVVVAEVLGLGKVDEAHYPLLNRTDPAYHRLRLCAFTRPKAGGPVRYHTLALPTRPSWSQDRLQVSPRAECLKVGQVREFVVEGVWLGNPVVEQSEHAAVLFVGPVVEAPYGDKVAAMPKSLFGALARGSAIFTGEIVERSWRPSGRLHQLAGLGKTIDVLEVVVDEVVQPKDGIAPGMRQRFDVPQGPRLTDGEFPFGLGTVRPVDYESMVVGGQFWFAVDRVSGKLALLDTVGI